MEGLFCYPNGLSSPQLMKEIMVTSLIDQFGLRREEADGFAALFQPVSLSKGEQFIPAGTICHKVGYVEEGMLKCIYVRGEDEVVDEFIFPKTMVTCYHSFLTDTPSQKAIVALSNCRLRVANKQEIENFAARHPFVETLSRKITEQLFLSVHEKLTQFRLEDATTRYLELQQRAPHLILQLPLYEIASYLNISPETLSRIRSRLARQSLIS